MSKPGLIEAFRIQAAARSLAKNTTATYTFWLRKFWRDMHLPASKWTGNAVSQWMRMLSQQGYGRVSRKQALCALVFVFKHVLRLELGALELPPCPPERKTLKVIPTREELARIFAGLKGMARLMAGNVCRRKRPWDA